MSNSIESQITRINKTAEVSASRFETFCVSVVAQTLLHGNINIYNHKIDKVTNKSIKARIKAMCLPTLELFFEVENKMLVKSIKNPEQQQVAATITFTDISNQKKAIMAQNRADKKAKKASEKSLQEAKLRDEVSRGLAEVEGRLTSLDGILHSLKNMELSEDDKEKILQAIS